MSTRILAACLVVSTSACTTFEDPSDPLLRDEPGGPSFEAASGLFVVRGGSYEARAHLDGSFSVGSRSPLSPPIVFRTESITRERDSFFRAGGFQPARGGGVERAWSGLVERLSAKTGGVEQTFHVPEKLAGHGDLLVKIRAVNAKASPAAEGLQVTHAGGQSVRYGHGTWIDARGVHTAVPSAAIQGAIHLVVPGGLLEESAYPAILDPLIGPESAVSAVDALVEAAGRQDHPMVATNAGQAYAAWLDERLAMSATQLIGTRIGANGAAIDATGVAISAALNASPSLSIAPLGSSGYLVANTFSKLVQATRIDALGQPIDTLLLANGPDYVAALAAGQDGDDALVAWFGAAEAQWHGARVSPGGDVLQAQLPASSLEAVAIVGSPSGALYVWTDVEPADVRAATLDAALSPVPPAGFPVSSASGTYDSPSGTWDGSEFVITWRDHDAFALRGARVTSTGDVRAEFVITPQLPDSATVAANQGRTWVAWEVAGQMEGVEILPDGAASPRSLGPGLHPALAPLGSQDFFLAFSDEERISSLLFDPEGSLLDPAPRDLTLAAPTQEGPASATDGRVVLMMWMEGGRLLGARLDMAGALLDAVPFEVSATVSAAPSVAFDGEAFVVTWTQALVALGPAEIRALRIDPSGVLLGPSIQLAADLTAASVRSALACSESRHLCVVVWSAAGNRVRFARLLDGVLLDPEGIPIQETGDHVAVAYGADRFALAWTRQFPNNEVRVATLAATTGPVDVSPFDAAAAVGTREVGGIGFDGENFLVVFDDTRLGSTDIFGARVTPDGVALSGAGFPIHVALGEQSGPAVANTGDGLTVVVSWTDEAAPQAGRITGAWLTADAVLDPDGVRLSDGEYEKTSHLTSLGGGRVLLSYARLDMSPGHGSFRVRTRVHGSGLPVGARCSSPDGCANRQCFEGFCCAEACADPCRTCAASPGTCTLVTGVDDPGTCDGDSTCDLAATCKSKLARNCLENGDCASGFCADGACCDAPCDRGCETCALELGTCETLAPGQPSAACAPFVCAGDEACPSACVSDDGCAADHRCESSTGACVLATARCDGDHTLLGRDGPIEDCHPLKCRGAACLGVCGSALDCVEGLACDADGRCVPQAPTQTIGGCAIALNAPVSWPGGWASVVLCGLVATRLARRGRRSCSFRAR